MFEGHRDLPPRIISGEATATLAPLPVRSPQQARTRLDAAHELTDRPPDLFHVPHEPHTLLCLYRGLTQDGAR